MLYLVERTISARLDRKLTGTYFNAKEKYCVRQEKNQ